MATAWEEVDWQEIRRSLLSIVIWAVGTIALPVRLH